MKRLLSVLFILLSAVSWARMRAELTEPLSIGSLGGKGQIMNPNFRDYKILTAKDAIEIETPVIETVDKDGPYGAKGIGEPGCVPTAPAIANAIYDAVSVRIKDLPITPEKVLAAIKAKQGLDPCNNPLGTEPEEVCLLD